MSTTSEAHDLLEFLTRNILEKRGFIVKQERGVRCYGAKLFDKYGRSVQKHSFRVDVYGERDGEIIMYEVGDCEQYKLDWLREHIGKTIHMPYLTDWCVYPPKPMTKEGIWKERLDRLVGEACIFKQFGLENGQEFKELGVKIKQHIQSRPVESLTKN